jgi:hypothetical protein
MIMNWEEEEKEIIRALVSLRFEEEEEKETVRALVSLRFEEELAAEALLHIRFDALKIIENPAED